MPDISSINAALSSLSVLKNMAQAMMNLRDAQVSQAQIIEFQNAVIDAQAQVFAVNEERTALIKRVGELEKKVTNLEAWETEKERYELKPIAHGSFAYMLKANAQGAEPPHQICTNCYQRGEKSILQLTPRSVANTSKPDTYACPRCKFEILA